MKTNIIVAEQTKRPNNPGDVRAMAMWHLQNTPEPLKNIRGGVIQFAVWWMRLMGVSKIMIKQTLLGLRSISDVSFKAMFEQPPEEIRACRNTLVRSVADTLTLIGVLELEILPDEKEMKELQDFWKRLKEPQRAPEKKEIQLNTETDPTGDKVTDGYKPDAAVPAVPETGTAIITGGPAIPAVDSPAVAPAG